MMPGAVSARVATFGVAIDGIVFAPGCVEDGFPVHLSIWGHSLLANGRPRGRDTAVGFGLLHREGDALLFEGRYDDTARGLWAFRMIHQLGHKARWSLGFDILQSDVDFLSDHDPAARGVVQVATKIWPSEVSPVLRPADPRTRTLALASLK